MNIAVKKFNNTHVAQLFDVLVQMFKRDRGQVSNMLKPIKKELPRLEEFLNNKEHKYSFKTRKSHGNNSKQLVQVLEWLFSEKRRI